MRSKWFKSEQATLQVALMKLIGTDEEAHRLNGSRQSVDVTTKPGVPTLTKEEIKEEIIKIGKALNK